MILFVDDDYEKYGFAAGMRGQVIFKNGKFLLSDKDYKYFFEEAEMAYIEIIGNIYENPDLIKYSEIQ